MNFDDNYFDVILIPLVLHEVDDNLRHKIIQEAKRACHSKNLLGGTLAIELKTYNPFSI